MSELNKGGGITQGKILSIGSGEASWKRRANGNCDWIFPMYQTLPPEKPWGQKKTANLAKVILKNREKVGERKKHRYQKAQKKPSMQSHREFRKFKARGSTENALNFSHAE